MQTLSALRKDPYFAKMFAYVHVLCWPILVWQINRFFPALKRAGITNALYTVNRWGFLKLVHTGDREDPHAYKPRPRTFRPLTDSSYASALPANLKGLSALTAFALLPRLGGGLRGSKIASRFSERGIARSAKTEGALPSPFDST